MPRGRARLYRYHCKVPVEPPRSRVGAKIYNQLNRLRQGIVGSSATFRVGCSEAPRRFSHGKPVALPFLVGNSGRAARLDSKRAKSSHCGAGAARRRAREVVSIDIDARVAAADGADGLLHPRHCGGVAWQRSLRTRPKPVNPKQRASRSRATC